jgi:hypothetical protein
MNDAAPPLRNSLGVISRPAMNRITIADISPMDLIVSFVIPFPFSLVVGLGYVVWLIYDVIRIINMESPTARQGGDTQESLKVQCKKCGNMNREGTNYCVKCGSLLQ